MEQTICVTTFTIKCARAGRFLLPDPSVEKPNWLEPFIEEYVSFPRGVHDDILDAIDCAVEATDVNRPREWAFFFGGP